MHPNMLTVGQIDPALHWQIAHRHDASAVGDGDLHGQVVKHAIGRRNLGQVEILGVERVGGPQQLQMAVEAFNNAIDVLAKAARQIA